MDFTITTVAIVSNTKTNPKQQNKQMNNKKTTKKPNNNQAAVSVHTMYVHR